VICPIVLFPNPDATAEGDAIEPMVVLRVSGTLAILGSNQIQHLPASGYR
jgi:hypothetical protein